jgi:hypothetical protein
MTFKAEDFEKKTGDCPRHGEQVMWLGCRHVGKEIPKGILLGVVQHASRVKSETYEKECPTTPISKTM